MTLKPEVYEEGAASYLFDLHFNVQILSPV